LGFVSSESTVLLSVRDSGTPAARSYAFTILVDGKSLDDRTLTPVESQEIGEISGQYQSLFDQSCRYNPTDYMEILGSGLFHLFFEVAWSQIRSTASCCRVNLVVASDIPEVLILPWEIVRPPDGDMLGLDPSISILRLPERQNSLPQFKGQLLPGPLRVVLAACAPRQSLDYAKEDESFLKAFEGTEVVSDSCDLGTFEELRKRVDEFRPQIVHLAGQGVLKDGQNYFAFEGSDGIADLESSVDILKAMPGVQMVFLSGCQVKSPYVLANLGIELVRAGLPLAMSWPGSIADAESAVGAFYGDLASGNTLESAAASMRHEIGAVHKQGAALLAFPSLYSRTDQNRTFDPQQKSVLSRLLLSRQQPPEGTTEGYTENFVGRRRELQRLVPALRESTVKAVIITGPHGTGKSTLAVRLAEELESAGFSVIAISSSVENPLSAARLIDALGRNDLADSIQAAVQALRNSENSGDKRLKEAIEALNLGQFLLVLDGFEVNLNDSGQIIDPHVAMFYLLILNNLDRSRAIITSERLPGNAMTLPQRAWEYAVTGLTRADFFRFLQRDGDLAARLRSGELNHQTLAQIYERTEGMPLCFDRIGKALGDVSPANPAHFIAEAQSVSQSSTSFCNEITSRLYGSLSPESRASLSRAAVYGVPINPNGLEAIAGELRERIKGLSEEWTKKALAFQEDNGLLVIRKELRVWLTEKLSKEEAKQAHEAAGDFLYIIVKGKKYKELGLTNLECSLEARAHFLAAGVLKKAIEVTSRISANMVSRGFYGEVLRLNQELLVQGEHRVPIRWTALAFFEQEDLEHALEWYQRGLKAPGRSEEDDAASWLGIASIDLRQGRYREAEENLRNALDVYRRKGDVKGEAEVLRGLASAEMAKGNYENARENLFRVLQTQMKTEDLAGQVSTLRDLIAIDLHQKDRDAAIGKLNESVEIFRKLGNLSGEAATLYDLASLDMEKENFDSATEEFKRALKIRRQIGDQEGEAAALHSLAMIDTQKGNVQEASEKFESALKIYQQTGDKPGEAAAFFQLGILAVRLSNNMNDGMRLLALSGIILRSIGSPEVRNVEPVIERMASHMKYTQDKFAELVREAAMAYRKDRGWGLLAAAFQS
jgi:tetratricopeptide (TPR) repeat protein